MNQKQIEEIIANAGQGDVDAQFILGAMYAMGQGVPHDHHEAVRWFHKAAEQGDPDAQRKLGMIYYHGQGVEQDRQAAVRWFRLAAEQGHDDAQANLGWLYAKGECLPQDDIQAYMWCHLSAMQGNRNAVKMLQLLGERLPPDQIDQARQRTLQWSAVREQTGVTHSSQLADTTDPAVETAHF
ncbi:MAG: sel1 repeat family protein [Magnetococcales bacterium]|nr:sel1 repeat family protein [Magnetococcales bacterium]